MMASSSSCAQPIKPDTCREKLRRGSKNGVGLFASLHKLLPQGIRGDVRLGYYASAEDAAASTPATSESAVSMAKRRPLRTTSSGWRRDAIECESSMRRKPRRLGW